MSLIATLIANPAEPCLTPALADSASKALSASAPEWLAEGTACDIRLGSQAGAAEADRLLRQALAGHPVDVVVRPHGERRRKILLADMDSTMIEQECIDELADAAGLMEEVAAITAKAMNGEIEFEGALRARVALLKGLPAKIISEVIAERITLAPGGRTLVATMKRNGGYGMLVSGGFTVFARHVAEQLGFDEYRANALPVVDGIITGQTAEPILGRDAKVAALHDIAARLGHQADDVIAVGDGANDLGMLEAAGTGLALHAKPSVAQAAPFRIDHGDLTALLYLQGYRRREFVE